MGVGSSANAALDAGKVSKEKRGKEAGGPDQIRIASEVEEKQLKESAQSSKDARQSHITSTVSKMYQK